MMTPQNETAKPTGDKASKAEAAARVVDVNELTSQLRAMDPSANRFILYALDHEKDCETHVGPIGKRMIGWVNAQQRAKRSVFVTAQEFKGRQRRSSQVTRYRVLFGDFDNGLPERFPVEPTLIIQTGANRYHVIWAIPLDGEQLTEHEWKGMMRRLAADYGADVQGDNPTIGPRLVGTINCKPERKGWRCRLIGDVGHDLSADALRKAFPPIPAPDPAYEPPRYEATKDPVKPTDPLQRRYRAYFEKGFGADCDQLAVLPKGNRHHQLFKRACRWGRYVHHGIVSRDEFTNRLIEACKANGYFKESPTACRGDIRDALTRSRLDCLDELPNREQVRSPRSNGHATNGFNGGANEPHTTKPNGTDNEPKEEPRHARNGNGHTNGCTSGALSNGGATALPPAYINDATVHAMHSDDILWPEVTRKGLPRARSQQNIRHFLEWRGASFTFNAFDLRTTIKLDGEVQPINDDVFRALRLEADAVGLSPGRDFFEDVCLDTARKNTMHPVRDYLDGLAWDNSPRLDTWLSTYAGAEDTRLNRAFARKVLIAAVRRVRKPGAKFDTALILEGPQGVGKSTLIRALASDAWFTDTVSIGADPKVVIEQTAGAWLVEMAELSGIRRGEVEHIKTMLSRQSDRARTSYARHAVDRPRQFVLIGTVNEGEYLRDTTGNRRFWPVRVVEIDLEALARDRDQLWAEAAHNEARGEAIELPHDLWTAAAEAQEARLISDPWQDILAPLLEGETGCVPVETLWAKLKVEGNRQDGNLGRRLGAIMGKLGFQKTRRFREGKLAYCYTNIKETRWLFL